MTGESIDDDDENDVALFMYSDTFGIHYASLELLDAEGRVLRSGPHRRP